MPVRSQIRSHLPCSPSIAWAHLVYLRDCDKWMAPDELDGIAFLIEGGKYAGFQISLPDNLKTLVTNVELLETGRYVRYRATEAIEASVPSHATAFFPFLSMKQALTLVAVPGGCDVLHEIDYEPNGLVGWFTCSLILAPSVRRSMNRSHARLVSFLNEQA